MESQLPAVTDAHLAPVSMSVERNPAALYLRRLPFSSGRRTMRQALEALHEWAEVRSTDSGPFLYPVTKRKMLVLRQMADQAVYRALRKRAGQAKVREFSPHDLRRTFASEMLDAGRSRK